ncbi:hypothetical protein DC498_11270 [Terrimonas sp.]|uniref:hypothetical protein n=1 Tax=Terrimonas sp. TaxID=1914338 RepID=UPI000D523431|nr:hypothetical protein [Terrimonas sp.]PVD52293.1 hypothetical protein DC498_11270 [Terrimonas sp.]
MNTTQFIIHRYTKLALLNLLLVALAGFILRYKILFSLPFIDQKHLLHGHSHFAFSGWVTHVLMLLLMQYLLKQKNEAVFKKYKWVINANLITAYGMLISFPIQGYGLYSIIFSTLSIFVSYVFAYMFWKDLNSLPEKSISHWWIKAALLFNILSSVGAFSLAFMMATKTIHQNWYLAAVYFFLHFQYNGWFFFACMGLASAAFLYTIPVPVQKKIFWLFAAACIPAYVLSALWLPIPQWSFALVVLAAFSQIAGWIIMVQHIKKRFAQIKPLISKNALWLFALSGIALTIKLLLQLGSVIPSLSKLAFGFRPIVIGYLHLILLGVITLFLLAFMMVEKNIQIKPLALTAVKIFTAGVILNEFLLMLQGIAAISFIALPYINELLLAAAFILVSGIFLLNISQRKIS